MAMTAASCPPWCCTHDEDCGWQLIFGICGTGPWWPCSDCAQALAWMLRCSNSVAAAVSVGGSGCAGIVTNGSAAHANAACILLTFNSVGAGDRTPNSVAHASIAPAIAGTATRSPANEHANNCPAGQISHRDEDAYRRRSRATMRAGRKRAKTPISLPFQIDDGLQVVQNRRAVRCPQSRTRIPTWPGVVALDRVRDGVRARGDVVDDAFGHIRIEEGVEEADILLFRLVQQGNQRRHQRSDGARAARSAFLAIDTREVVGRAHRDVGHATPGLPVIDRNDCVRSGLVRRHLEDFADSPAAGPAALTGIIRIKRLAIVPDDVAAVVDLRATATQDEVVARRMIDVDFIVPVRRVEIRGAMIARSDANRDAQRTRGDEQIVKLVDALLIGGIRAPARPS